MTFAINEVDFPEFTCFVSKQVNGFWKNGTEHEVYGCRVERGTWTGASIRIFNAVMKNLVFHQTRRMIMPLMNREGWTLSVSEVFNIFNMIYENKVILIDDLSKLGLNSAVSYIYCLFNDIIKMVLEISEKAPDGILTISQNSISFIGSNGITETRKVASISLQRKVISIFNLHKT